MKLTINGDVVTHSLLGEFVKTGQYRAPKLGEYYLCEKVPGIGCCSEDNSKWRKEILFKSVKP